MAPFPVQPCSHDALCSLPKPPPYTAHGLNMWLEKYSHTCSPFNPKLRHNRLFLLCSSTTLLSSQHVSKHPSVYLFPLTPAKVHPFDTCVLKHFTVSGCDSALVPHSRLLPSLIIRQAAISQQRLGITIVVHKTKSPTHP